MNLFNIFIRFPVELILSTCFSPVGNNISAHPVIPDKHVIILSVLYTQYKL
jgi:hypothetical protein